MPKYKATADKHRRKQLFVVGDQIMVFLRTYSKLMSKKYGPYQILKKINDNAYVVALTDSMVALTDSMGISKTFNVADIFSYYSSDEPMYPDILENSRSSFFQVGETNTEQVALEYIERWD